MSQKGARAIHADCEMGWADPPESVLVMIYNLIILKEVF